MPAVMYRILAALALAAAAPPTLAQDGGAAVVDVSVTPGALCTVDASGAVRCGVNEFRASLRPPPDLPPATDVDLGAGHACAILVGGEVRCWGENGLNQLDVPPDLRARRVSAGNAHSCAIDLDGRLACWGLDTDGRLSPPDPTARHLDVSVGDEFACAVRADGRTVCWGADFGRPSAQALAELGPATAVTVDSYGTCVVEAAGTVRCPRSFAPVELSGGPYVGVRIGNYLVCGLDAVGAADCTVREDGPGIAEGLPAVAAAIEAAGPFAELALGSRFGFAIACGATVDGRLECFAGTDDLDLPELGGAPDFVPTLSASVYSDTTAELFWSRPESFRTDLRIAGFELLRDGEPYASLGRVYSFVDDALRPGEPARYAVRAIDGGGRAGPVSNAVTVDTGGRGTGTDGDVDGYSPPARPAQPAALRALVYGPRTVELVWERAGVPVFGHEVRRNGELVAFTRGTSAFLEGLAPDEASRFEVLAVDRNGTILGVASVATVPGGELQCR